MKLESLVIVNQNVTVNTFPGLVHTARHTTKINYTRSQQTCLLAGIYVAHGKISDWGEVVTR